MSPSSLQERRCLWCEASLTAGDIWHSKKCRQTAWRFLKTPIPWDPGDKTLRLAYADPPYPGLSAKYYKDEPTFKGEVDHLELAATLMTYDGWALSTSAEAMPWVRSLFPAQEDIVVCPWVKPLQRVVARGPATVTEYVLVRPGRRRLYRPATLQDAFTGAVARLGDSTLIGRKPIKFVNWLFRLLGASPVDLLDDLYPGSGVVGRCWRVFCRLGPERRRPGRPERRAPIVAGGQEAPRRDPAATSPYPGRATPGPGDRRRRTID
jgi:hypothetical protein